MARNERKSTDVTYLFAMRLEKAITEETKRTGKSQNAIASEIGITSSSLSDYIADRKTPTIDSLYKICEHFNLSADYLLGKTEIPNCTFNIEDISDDLGLSLETVKDLISVEHGWKEPTKVTEIILMADAINRQEAPK